MSFHSRVRVLPMDGEPETLHATPDDAAAGKRLGASLRSSIMRTRQWLLDRQHPDGHWVGELEGDSILESEYLLLLAYLDRHHTDEANKLANCLLQEQLPTGGWAMYPGGAMEISGSVKAYFALKLTGHDPSSPAMKRAREAILAHGGADAVNSFTRFYLALLGQISYEQCPAVPAEAMLLPKWFPINIYRISSWSRTILVPLAIMSSFRPVRHLPVHLGIGELFLQQPENWPPLACPGQKWSLSKTAWEKFFRFADRSLKFLQRHNCVPLRQRALRKAESWMLARFSGSEGLGAIFPPMVWSIIALRCLGYRDDSPELAYCYEHLEGLKIEQGGAIRLQPCKSPVWDTAITVRALAAAGLGPNHAAMQQGIDWLLSQEITRRGDWAETVTAEASGWCFEYANEFYPDVDDTIMTLMALHTQFEDCSAPASALPADLRLHRDDQVVAEQAKRVARIVQSSERARKWILAMQNSDGGWGAFDRNNDHEFLCHVPFADHNAMIDPSTPDLAGRVLESLGLLGARVGEPVVDRAVRYIADNQEADGCWFGRWGVNYIYGAWQAVTGLRQVGVPKDDPMVVRAVNWLIAHQQPSGGWGESPDSYADPHLRGQGPTTASQTAWALLGLLSAGEHDHPAVARGIRYLIDHQSADGSWDEPEFTGTGFPRVFYLRYHLYPIYFPLLALSQYAQVKGHPLPESEPLIHLLHDAMPTGMPTGRLV